MAKRLRFMTDLIAPLRVPPGSEVKLHRAALTVAAGAG